MIKFSIPNFLHFRTQQVFLKYLAKFQSITNCITHVFWTFISENLRPPLIFLFPSLGWELEKMTSFSQNTTRVEIVITISTEVRIRIRKALTHKLVQFSTLTVFIISTRAVFWGKWRHFLQFSTRTWNKEN